MRHPALVALLLAFSVVSTTALSQAQPAPADADVHTSEVAVKSAVVAVTVYRGQALVTRELAVPGAAGLAEIVVSDLPDRVIPGSLFAESTDGVEVRSIRYRVRPVSQDVREEVRKLDDDIRKTTDAIAANTKGAQLLAEQRSYLEKLAQFTAPTANLELTKGILNAETLKTLTTYQFDQRAAIAAQELKLANEARDLQEVLTLKQRQRAEITGNSSRSIREAVVFLNQTRAGSKLRVRYLVDQATWAPSYNIRADADRKEAKLEYQASIEQRSGEDWTNVAMTLSTATPSLVANAPQLSPLSIALTSRPAGAAGGDEALFSYGQVKGELTQQRLLAENARNTYTGNTSISTGTLNISGNVTGVSGNGTFNIDLNGNNTLQARNDEMLNKVADQIQVLELVARDTKKDEADARNRNPHEGIVVTYQLAAQTSLPSRADRQLIQIAAVPVQSTFYKVAIPVLTNYVYDEAQVVNTSKNVLLAGPIASYVGGQFVGNGDIPTVAAGQPFTVGFGIDSSLRASRERVDKVETTQGGNKVINYTYRIAVDNFGTAPASVRIMDRMPIAKDSEVKITLAETPGSDLSKDKEYLQFQRKNGLLRWDVTVPAEKNGSEAFAMSYKMGMEYDKNLAITGQTLMKIQELDRQMMNMQQH